MVIDSWATFGRAKFEEVIVRLFSALLVLSFSGFQALAAGSSAGSSADLGAADSTTKISSPTKEHLVTLEKFQKRLQSTGQVRSKVNRRTSFGLLGTEKRAEGELLVSQGRVRMDLRVTETDERQLLVVGSKSFWAVTYPSKDFKEAAVQVVTGPVKSKKSGSVGFLALLGKDGFLKSFTCSGVGLDKDGGIRYYLQPKVEWVEAKRALLALGPEVNGQRAFREILIWDSQDNESQYTLDKVKFEKAKAANDQFTFTPPKNADVMSL